MSLFELISTHILALGVALDAAVVVGPTKAAETPVM
jgi:hypothetical protein